MSEPASKIAPRYTWEDYRTWPDAERWEIIGGDAFLMSPAPGTRHQRVVGEMYRQMATHFLGKKCRVFIAPTDVRLSTEDVVQPDILVVCDPKQIRQTHIEGPPTLVVEVVSPSTALQDRSRKLDLYAKCGVREVWLVTPFPSLVEVFVLAGDTYRLIHAYRKDENFRSVVFRSLELELQNVFDFPVEPGEETGMVKEGRPPYGRARS